MPLKFTATTQLSIFHMASRVADNFLCRNVFMRGGLGNFVSDAFLFCRNVPYHAVIGSVENVAALRIISGVGCEGRVLNFGVQLGFEYKLVKRTLVGRTFDMTDEVF